MAGAYNVPLNLLREHREGIIGHLDAEVVLGVPVGSAGRTGARRRCATPGWPTCTSSTAGSPPGRRKRLRGQPWCATLGPGTPGPPGRRLDRGGQRSGQHRRPETQVGGGRDRRRAGRCRAGPTPARWVWRCQSCPTTAAPPVMPRRSCPNSSMRRPPAAKGELTAMVALTIVLAVAGRYLVGLVGRWRLDPDGAASGLCGGS